MNCNALLQDVLEIARRFFNSPIISRVRIMGLAIILLMSVTACVGGSGAQIAVHGKFCGPNHPPLPPNITREEAIEFLTNTAPQDGLDTLCKNHDICYALKGAHNHECDLQLSNSLNNFQAFSDCRSKIYTIRYALLSKPSTIKSEGGAATTIAGAAGDLSGRAVGAAINSPFLILQTAFAVAEEEKCEGMVVDVRSQHSGNR